jgi:hypothetical protein
MESCDILEEYLVAQSSLESILSFEKFKIEVRNATNRRFSPQVLRSMYQALAQQRATMVMDVVRDNIRQMFDVPLDSLPESKRTVSKLSIADLCTRLNRVSDSLQVDHDLNQQQIKVVLQLISDRIEVLLQLDGRSNGDGSVPGNDTVDDVVTHLTKLESYLKPS